MKYTEAQKLVDRLAFAARAVKNDLECDGLAEINTAYLEDCVRIAQRLLTAQKQLT